MKNIFTPRNNKIISTIIVGIGLIALLTTVSLEKKISNTDEAAWIFDSYYLDLYLSGDWDNEYWLSFEKYASHPPAAKYLFGMLLHTLGKPIKSMEPKQFWFENDLDIVNFPQRFIHGLHKRLRPSQLIAGRYMASVFAWLASVALLLLAWRLVGPLAGMASFVILIIQPGFRLIATLATADSFMLMLSILSILLALEIARATVSHKTKSWYFCIALSIILGLSLATKISSFSLIPAIIVTSLLASKNLKTAKKVLMPLTISIILALVVAYILDPALHISPISTTLERFTWRMDRIEIQQLIFIPAKLSTIGERLAYALYSTFFLSAEGVLIFVTSTIGLIFSRSRPIILFITLYFFVLTVVTIPMTWERYLIGYLPFVALASGLGTTKIVEIARDWRKIVPKKIRLFLVTLTLIIITTALLQHLLSPFQAHMPPKGTTKENRIARMFAYSLIHPGKELRLHQELFKYFLDHNNKKRAEYQRQQLELMQSLDGKSPLQ